MFIAELLSGDAVYIFLYDLYIMKTGDYFFVKVKPY